MAGKRLSLQELARILNAPEVEVARAVDDLEDKYRGPIVVQFDGNTAIMTVEGQYLENLWMLGKGELSSAELRTLATVAYYEPVRQSELVKARGNRAYEHLRKLEEMGLVVANPQGNTKVLRLTRKFYDYFGEDVAERIRRAQTFVKPDRSRKSAGESGEGSEAGPDIHITDVRRG